MKNSLQLDALQTKNGNYFVYFFETYGAYFNPELNAFATGSKKMDPWRADALNYWNQAKDNWSPSPETTILTTEQSEKLLSIVENDFIDGIPNVRERTLKGYAEEL